MVAERWNADNERGGESLGDARAARLRASGTPPKLPFGFSYAPYQKGVELGPTRRVARAPLGSPGGGGRTQRTDLRLAPKMT